MTNSNDLQTIIIQALEQLKSEQGEKFDLLNINLAELERRTGISRAKLRRLHKNGFQRLKGQNSEECGILIIKHKSGFTEKIV